MLFAHLASIHLLAPLHPPYILDNPFSRPEQTLSHRETISTHRLFRGELYRHPDERGTEGKGR